MELLVLVLGLTSCFIWGVHTDVGNYTDSSANNSHPDKDMYVIHATVYQVGILTNRTDNMTNDFNSTGNQESLTLYHTNGTNIDLSAIPEPFLTNVTAQSLVGVAPVSQTNGNYSVPPTWGALNHPAMLPLENVNVPVHEADEPSKGSITKRSLDNFFSRLFKRDTKANTPIKIMNGSAVIPPEAGVQSIGLPPLLFLHNNFSEIPVPIPNTSVVQYAKINTLVQKP